MLIGSRFASSGSWSGWPVGLNGPQTAVEFSLIIVLFVLELLLLPGVIRLGLPLLFHVVTAFLDLCAETLELFRANGAKASAIVRGLSDAELDRSGTVLTDIPAMTVQQAIEGILINHVHEHLGSIRATTGAK